MGTCQSSSGFDDIAIPSDYEGLKFVCQVWKNTYSNLFDYTADHKNYEISYTNITQSCRLKVENNQIVSKPTHEKNVDDILRIDLNNNEKIMQPCENVQKLSAYQLWLVVKSTPSEKYKLKQGDILRIGKQKVKVKEIIIDEHEAEAPTQIKAVHTIYDNLTKEKSQGFDYDKSKYEEMPVCRVCLDQGQKDNPLIAPCKCSGSAKYIHIKCIQQWFNKLIDPRTINSAIIISWKPLVCELCHQNLPFKIYLDQQKNFTVNIPRPKKPYIVLNPVSKNNKAKIYYLISFADKNKLSIGRKKEADIVMDECSSISRFHSFIEYEESTSQEKKSKFLLSDNESKFGTLALLRKPIRFKDYFSGLTFQFGGNIITALYGKNKKFSKKKWQQDDQLNSQTSSESDEEDEENQ